MVLYLIFSWCQHRRDLERVIISKAKHRVLDLCTFPHQRSKSTHCYKHVFCFAINILTALGAVQHVLCDCYADKIFCEFSPHQCFNFGLSQLGSLPTKMDCFDQSIWWFDGWHGIKSSNAFFQLLCAVAIFNPTVGSLRGSSWSRSSFEICYLLVKIWRQLHQQSRDANIDLNSTETNVGQQN